MTQRQGQQRDDERQAAGTAVPAPRGEAVPRPAALVEEHVRGLLAEHVPISLILDLAMPQGPHSRELLEDEGLPEQAWWEPRDGHA